MTTMRDKCARSSHEAALESDMIRTAYPCALALCAARTVHQERL